MGLLQDTVRDARRPLPASFALRRSAADASPIETDDPPEPADPGALTVYRLQKEGGSAPPMASPAGPRPAREAGAPAGRPEGIAVLTHGAVRPDRKVIDRVETRQDRLPEQQSDDSGVPASRVPAAPVAALMEAGPAPAGSNPSSADVGNVPARAPVPASVVAPAGHGEAASHVNPSDSQRERDSGNKPSTGWSRENGQDAPSEDLSVRAAGTPGRAAESAQDASPLPASIAPVAPIAATAPIAPVAPTAATAAGAHVASAQPVAAAAPVARSGSGAPAASEPIAPAGSHPSARAVADPRPARYGAFASGSATFPREPGIANAGASPGDAGPRLSIGRIEVVVLAPAPQPAAPPPPDTAAFLSKHYLRRL